MDDEKIEQQDKQEVKEVKKKKVEPKVEEKVEQVIMENIPPWLRFSMLKAELRKISLEKDESGYKSQYFYVALQDMQKVFTELELKYLITSRYTEETRAYYGPMQVYFKNFAIRTAFDSITEDEITSTEIDITNLKQITDPYEIKNEVLRISEPKDAWKTLYLDFFEPQNLGSISTYFQRYTYNQLYDFQETKEDKIEKKGKLEGKVVVKDEETKSKKETKEDKKVETTESPKDKRLGDEAAELRKEIKKIYVRDDIVKELNGRKLGSMSLAEAQQFNKDMEEKYTKKENEGEL